ncbi:cytochrome P450 [Reticulibacter mediterranei]|uniref:Cytochrome P450 n=1 Tax=Reticulibacter mediterranei TaxID=2778369 RepID=A0A8J3N4K6_9CHLR|nr:cytochrome P450 [Reticulibacter mediterranei]GHO98139.1 cytochrome P450 [Reticulibacter mediterranei]
MQQISFNDLLSQNSKSHPYAFYTKLREQGPLTFIDDFGGMGRAWLVTSYEDAVAILKDPRFVKDRSNVFSSTARQEIPPEEMTWENMTVWRRDLLSVDPPDHTRLRSLVSKAFTPRILEQWRPRIQQLTDELLDAVQERGEMDLINDFAFPLPINVISDILGIPLQDRLQFRTWTQKIFNAPENSEQQAAKNAAVVAFLSYVRGLLTKKRSHPSDDLTSALVQAREDKDALSEAELFSTIWLLINAGHETTVNLIGNGTLALLQHPDQMHLLQQHPELLSSAVEELLRYTSPVSITSPRWAREDVSLHGEVIPTGDMIFISLIAANADPQQFTDPEVLDLTRQVNKQLAFGRGMHACLGAPLARMEGQIAFSTLLRRMPRLQLACDPEQLVWNRHFTLRGIKALPVTF